MHVRKRAIRAAWAGTRPVVAEAERGWIGGIDDHELGVGPVTLELQKAYLDTVRGASERWAQWLDHVPQLART